MSIKRLSKRGYPKVVINRTVLVVKDREIITIPFLKAKPLQNNTIKVFSSFFIEDSTKCFEYPKRKLFSWHDNTLSHMTIL